MAPSSLLLLHSVWLSFFSMDISASAKYLIDYLFCLALVAGPSWVFRRLLVQFLLPPGLDGSGPLDQAVHRIVAYFLPGLLAVFAQATVDSWKPSVFGLTVLALEVMTC